MAFAGLIVFSALTVRFPVAGAEKNELEVIKYSLTDSIKRGEKGGFSLTYASADAAKGETAKTQREPCPT